MFINASFRDNLFLKPGLKSFVIYIFPSKLSNLYTKHYSIISIVSSNKQENVTSIYILNERCIKSDPTGHFLHTVRRCHKKRKDFRSPTSLKLSTLSLDLCCAVRPGTGERQNGGSQWAKCVYYRFTQRFPSLCLDSRKINIQRIQRGW